MNVPEGGVVCAYNSLGRLRQKNDQLDPSHRSGQTPLQKQKKRGDSPHGLQVKQVQTRTDLQPYLPSPSFFCILLVFLHTDESKSVCIYCSTPTPKGITAA